MAEESYDEYDNEEETSDKPKGLRAQLESVLDKNKTLESELASLKTSLRQKEINDILSAKGIDSKVAALIPSTIEDVNEWLEEYAPVFGSQTSTGSEAVAEATPKVNATANEINSASRLNSLSLTASSPNLIADLDKALSEAKTQDEFNAILAKTHKSIL